MNNKNRNIYCWICCFPLLVTLAACGERIDVSDNRFGKNKWAINDYLILENLRHDKCVLLKKSNIDKISLRYDHNTGKYSDDGNGDVDHWEYDRFSCDRLRVGFRNNGFVIIRDGVVVLKKDINEGDCIIIR